MQLSDHAPAQSGAGQAPAPPNRRVRPGARRLRGLPRRRGIELAALDWQQYGACRTENVGVFFAPDSAGEPQLERLRRLVQAKRVCAACPVREPCRSYALENEEEYGVWGGLSESERKHLIAERRG